MVEAINVLYTILYTLKSLILYSLLVTGCLIVLYLPSYGLFKLFSKKLSWNLSALFSTYIVSVICVGLLYFVPFWFMGLPMKGYELIDAKFLFFLKLFGLFLLYAIFVALITQLFVFLGAYFYEKFKFKSGTFKLILTLFIIALILNIIVMIFPWILGGILMMIWF